MIKREHFNMFPFFTKKFERKDINGRKNILGMDFEN